MFIKDSKKFDNEGRVICAEFEKFYLINTCNQKFDYNYKTREVKNPINYRYSERKSWPSPTAVSTRMGGGIPKVPSRFGQEETDHLVRRFERGTQPNRYSQPGLEPSQRRLHSRGARVLH